MKKTFPTIMAILLCIGYGVLSLDMITHSKEPGYEDSKFAPGCNNDMCCIDYKTALEKIRNDWEKNLKQLTDQQKAASDMVDEAYESLRTYNCWAEYICRAVQYSGHAPIQSAIGGLRSDQLGVVPGCQKPEKLRMEVEYDSFTKTMKKIPVLGVLPKVIDEAFVDNKINYFPHCQTDGNNNRNPNIKQTSDNYTTCKQALEINFGCPVGAPDAVCLDSSTAFVKIDNALKKTSADQKSSALERKLGSIVGKMHAMETHVGYLSNFLQQLDSRFACYAKKCS